MRKTTAIAHNCVAKWMVFLRNWNRAILTKHKLVTFCTKCRPILGSAGSAGPRGPATWTDTEGFFSWSGPHLPPPGSDPWDGPLSGARALSARAAGAGWSIGRAGPDPLRPGAKALWSWREPISPAEEAAAAGAAGKGGA